MLITALLTYSYVFAEAPDWRKQNADLESQQADTAKKNADTAAENANTEAVKQNTAAQGANMAASQNENQSRIITPVPVPKETNGIPAGFISCVVIQAGWHNGRWVPEHRVCKYNPTEEGAAWIEGYWACTQYKTTGNMNAACTNWDWKPGHWVKKFESY